KPRLRLSHFESSGGDSIPEAILDGKWIKGPELEKRKEQILNILTAANGEKTDVMVLDQYADKIIELI
ncbi:14511_t:CDS:2, partial [Funneliformis geosporum]